MNPNVRATVLMVLIAVGGCDGNNDPMAPEGDPLVVAISTDREIYTPERLNHTGTVFDRYQFTVVAEFRNDTAETVYLGRCRGDSTGPHFFLAGMEPEAEAAWGEDDLCVGVDNRFPVAPGETRVDELEVVGPLWWSWDGEEYTIIGTVQGQFRLGYSIYECQGPSPCDVDDPFPDRWWSNTFEVRVTAEDD